MMKNEDPATLPACLGFYFYNILKNAVNRGLNLIWKAKGFKVIFFMCVTLLLQSPACKVKM